MSSHHEPSDDEKTRRENTAAALALVPWPELVDEIFRRWQACLIVVEGESHIDKQRSMRQLSYSGGASTAYGLGAYGLDILMGTMQGQEPMIGDDDEGG